MNNGRKRKKAIFVNVSETERLRIWEAAKIINGGYRELLLAACDMLDSVDGKKVFNKCREVR